MIQLTRIQGTFPSVVPVLPLHGAVLIPKTVLPVPFSESDFDHLIRLAVRDFDGYVGIVQPVVSQFPGADMVPLHKTGSLGKVSDVKTLEEDDKLLVIFEGICRFHVIEDAEPQNDVRCISVDYSRYAFDLQENEEFPFDRDRLVKALETCYKKLDVNLNWKEIRESADQNLIAALAMVCPLGVRERQAVLESPSLKDQTDMITALLEFSANEPFASSMTYH